MTLSRNLGSAAALALAVGAAARCAPETAAFAPPPPLRIGVGGDYPAGLDGVLVSRGLPHERIFSWELSDPAALKPFGLILLSCPVAVRGDLDPPLLDWIRAGGRAYVETWLAEQGPHPLRQIVTVLGGVPEHTDALITLPSHPIAAGLDASKAIDLFHLQGILFRPLEPSQAQVVVRFCPDGGGSPLMTGAAVICQPLGEGELVYSGAPLSFCLFHRGPTTEGLMAGIISYLARGRAVPRLVAEAPAPHEPPAARVERVPAPGEAGALPPGFSLVDQSTDDRYDVAARLAPTAADADRPSVLLLDGQFDDRGQPLRPTLWLVLRRDRVELRSGKLEEGAPLAAARWQPPAPGTELLVKRRPGAVSVVVGDTELLRAETKAEPGGAVAVSEGLLALGDPLCQPVGEPVFTDDFMREPGEASPWTAVSGGWRNVGVGSEEESVNGFYFRGESAETGLAAAGDWWWEDYAVTAAVRLESGAAACGLCALRQSNGDGLAFVVDSAKSASSALRLVRRQGDQGMVLAERAGSLVPGQWYRLGLRLRGGKVEALLDGEVVLSATNPTARGGGVALMVRGGAARFDDVVVQPAALPLQAPLNEGSPAPGLPVSLGPEDSMTWANPAAAWTACPERPSLLWHEGDFPGELNVSVPLEAVDQPALRRLILAPSPSSPESEWLSVAVSLLPRTNRAGVTLALPGGRAQTRELRLARGERLKLARRADATTVLCGQSILNEARGLSALRRVGLEIDGRPLRTDSLTVTSPEIRDYTFATAPTDWWSSSGTWEVAARWACDSRWSWFAGWGEGEVAIWNKRPLPGDVVVDYYVGVKMVAPGGPETERCRDLNTVLCGDRANPRSGYSFILGGDGGVKTQLLRNGVVVAESADLRVPAGYGVHHEWHHLRASRIGRRVELDLEGRPVFRYEDPDPLPGGYVGLWTRDSGILIPRVTIYQ